MHASTAVSGEPYGRVVPEAIAMVGAGCRFPRGAHGLPEFWRLLREETDAIEEVPADRWDVDRYYDADPHKRGAMYSRWGSFLDGVDQFDPAFFGIAPREAHEMDPQQRLLLEVAWEALEDAGQVPTDLAGTRTSVFTGVIGMDYTLLHAHQAGLSGIGAWYASGREFSFGPGRLSHLLGLQGPSMSVNTACSSSLVAIHLACQSLRSGESDLALAGGVNLILSPELSIFLCKVRAMSRDGRCKPFDASADGIVRGEGCALVVLKRLSDALADGDDILAVIRGTAVNHDGASAGLTVPSGEAQQRLLRDALAAAGVAPADIDYVEAHGTGTPLGDPIELSALRNVLGQDRPRSHPLFVGSLKSNFGHMDSAAGVAGLLKTALVLRHGQIPATIHVRERNPRIRWDWPVDVATELTPLPAAGQGRPRLAGVSAFGLSGTNAHVIIEAAPPHADARAEEPEGPVLLPLSARSDAALTDLARAYRDRLTATADVPPLRDLAHTAGARRTHHKEHRLAVIGSGTGELAARLGEFLEGRPSPGLNRGSGETEGEREARVVLVFSGQGSQWPGMARELLGRDGDDWRAFRDTFDACDALVREQAGWSPREEISAPEADSRLTRTEFAQPVIFAVQVALAALWRSWGIEPAAVVGHSMGEIAAAQVAGALTLEDASRVAVHRGRLLAESTGQGRMAVAELSEPDTRRALEPYAGLLWPAAVNSSRSTVVSGDAEAAERFVAHLTERGIGCRMLPGDHPFHSPYMTPYQDRLAKLLDGLRPSPPTVPVVTTTHGGTGDEELFDTAHWVRNIREPVQFAAAADALLGQGYRTFLEIGPHPVLTLPLTHAFEDTGNEGTLVVPSLRRGVAATETLLTSVGALYAAGAPVRWKSVPPSGGRPAKLPSYPWQRRRYWLQQTQPPSNEGPALTPQLPVAQQSLEERSEPPVARNPQSPRDRRQLEDLVARSAARVLGHEPGSIRRRQGFADMGMDSLTSLELRDLLQHQVGPLPATVALDHPTVERLTTYLWDRRAERQAPEAAAPEQVAERQASSVPAAGHEPIAVIGLGCRFPGGGNGPDGYWRMLSDATDAIAQSPEGRFDDRSRWKGAWLDDVDHFDPRFFRIPPREAKVMDPQQRLFLEVAWEALEHAGQTPDRLTATRTGVFVGMNSHDYAELIANAPQNVDAFYGTGNSFCSTPGRLSYFLGVHGPSLAVDTACSSSLVAVHLAVRSLRSGESEVAVAGGVNVILRSTIHRASQAAGALAGDGRCKTFDASADGYNRGEGCGVVVLKPLGKALADGDRVLATILGSSVNQDGPSSGLTVPNGPAQSALVRDALVDARVSPAEIGYVEAHGTGTPLGDPIELQALGAALSALPGRQRITVGSVKTNMGHLEAASGIAGLIKTVLVLQRGEIPPHLHFSEPNPAIPWAELPFDVSTRPVPWPQDRHAAGVSAFGFSGTNAHVVLGRAPRQSEPSFGQLPDDGRPYLLPLSASDEEALTAQAGNYRELLTGGAERQPGADETTSASGIPLRDLCYTASTRRAHQTHRLTVVGRTRTELAERLAAFEDGDRGLGVSTGRADGRAERKLAFVFSGHGSQWRGMARLLLRQDPAFREAMAWCDDRLRPHIGWSVLDHLERGADTPFGPKQQELVFAVQIALARRWQSLGVRPAAVVGHSMGEVAAAHAAGVLGIEDAVRLIHERAAVQERLVGSGAMGVVGLPADEAETALAGYEDRLWVAVSNSARSTVLSGDETALEEVLAALKRRQVFSRRIDAAGAGHCPRVEPLDRELAGRLSWIRPADGDLPCYSSVTGGLLDGDAFGAAYWGRNLRDRVRFSSAVRAMAGDGFDTFLEISPHPLLLTFIEQDLRDLGVDGVLVPSLRRDSDDFTVMLDSLGTLHAHGYVVDWERMYPAGGQLTDTPAYPWQRKRYWLAGPQGGAPGAVPPRDAAGAVQDRPPHPLLARRTRTAGSADTRLFEADLDGGLLGALPVGKLWGAGLVPGAAWLEMALAAGRERFGAGPLCMEAVELPEPLLLDGAVGGPEGEPAATVAQLSLTDTDHIHDIAGAADTALFTVHTFPALPETGTTTALRARGRLMASADTATAARPAFTGTDEVVDPAEPGEALAAAGVGMDGLRVTAAGRADGTFTAEFESAPDGAWILPPGLLEAALRTLALAAGQDPQVPPLLPRSVARLVLLRAPDRPRLTVHACLTDRTGPGVRGDVSVLDEDGTPVALLSGVTLEPPSVTPVAAGTRDRLDALLYTHRWQPSPRAAALPAAEPVDGAWWLVLADRGGVADALTARLAARGERTVLIAPDAAAGHGGLAKLVRDSLRTPGCRGAVHLWALDLPVGAGTAALTDPAAGCAYDAVLNLARALGASGTARPVWYVTRGACATGTSGTPGLPVAETQAPLWSLAGVAALEHPAAWGGLLDLDPRTTGPDAEAAVLVDELVAPDGEDHVALRSGRRLVQRVARDRTAGPVLPLGRIEPGGAYLVAEGASRLGLHIARWLSERGAGRVVLTCGPEADVSGGDFEEELDRLRAVGGTELLIVRCDPADRAALAGLLEAACDGGLPLRGVVWLAVDWELGDTAAVGLSEITDSVRSRALGAWHLDELLNAQGADSGLEFFVAFSGIASFWGSLGVARQAPADALLAALVQRRRAQGRAGLCVRWAPWEEAGNLTKDSRAMLVRAGLEPLRPETAVEVLDHLVAAGSVEAGVCQVDWGIMLPLYQQVGWPLFHDLEASDDTAGATAAASLLQELAALDPEERQGLLVGHVLTETAVVLGAESGDEFDSRQGFFDLGMNSITALEMKVRLQRRFDCTLPNTLVFEYPNAEALAGFLALDVLGLGIADAPGRTGHDPTGTERPQTASEFTVDVGDDDLTARFEREMAGVEALGLGRADWPRTDTKYRGEAEQ
ncbi:type I polyketide synthase [Streptomyces olivochromogenes]|uniref:type I polyketide synthase n=1 Tax=Streptomyces olivochromogenes TaxID=1963 RepID=UPI001F31A9A2|nr:type I polyketide synthase [Streptomyces olivochromogenes]MCF3131695.1 acyltransferase domain-containing protein [Streptomyces olivochromogenes]